MSRIGQTPILIPQGVTVKINNNRVEVNGPKGNLISDFRPEIAIKMEGDQVIVSRKKDNPLSRSLHGLTRTLIANMIKGVNELFVKKLELVGTGYRVILEGVDLKLSLGFSHPVVVKPLQGIAFLVEKDNKISVTGPDKILVGQVAADIRKIRPPDAYKGKGIRYEGEIIKTKPGKTGKTAAGGFGG